MEDLRSQVLKRISDDLRAHTLQQKYTGEPLIDLDCHILILKTCKLVRAMFVDGKFGSKII